MERRTLTLSLPTLAADALGFFRWGRVAEKVLVTNDAGDFAFLTQAEFDDLLAGRVVAGHARFAEFQEKGFIRDGLDLDAFAAKLAKRTRHVHRGPRVHVVTLTSRQKPAAANGQAHDQAGADMTPETAIQVAELALQSTSPSISFEFQAHGGEPLLNFATLRHLVEHAQTRNQKSVGKTLTFRVVTNLTAMTEEIAEWLIANEVVISTTLDGPAAVHDPNRQERPGSKHADVVRWIEYFHRRYAELGRDLQRAHVNALLTVTRRTLTAWREVIDEYVARGVRSIHLRPLERTGFDQPTWAAIGYTLDEYFTFYRRALDYVIELSRRGVDISERAAAILATKILTTEDAGIVDIQSPDGAGTGQLAYDIDGRVFPDDEARRVDSMGDPIFVLGHARDLTNTNLLKHPAVRSIAAASLLDTAPMCADCWNKPYCGFSPVHNFVTQGDLFGQRPHCFECKEHETVSRRVFELLANDSDPETVDVLKRWSTARSATSSDRSKIPAP